MVYLLSLPGGWVADRIFGQRRAVLYGGILIVAGQFFLMSPGVQGFYAGLGLLMLGTGMLKPNVSTMVGQLYAPGRPAARFGLLDFLHGHQSRRTACAAGLRIGRRADRLAAGLWRGGRGNDRRADPVHIGRQVSRIRGTPSGAARESGGGKTSETQCGAGSCVRRADSRSGGIARGDGPRGALPRNRYRRRSAWF